jgi:hypothetical protein
MTRTKGEIKTERGVLTAYYISILKGSINLIRGVLSVYYNPL